MVIEKAVPPFFVWLFGGTDMPSALWIFAWTTIVLGATGTVVSFLVAIYRYGPRRGLSRFGRGLLQALPDLLVISPRRVLGLTYLAAREAFRRRIWVALLLFLILLMFAGWNLAPNSDKPAEIYLNFVLTAATFIMLPVAVFAAAFSLPNDIKNRTIYTVATKPVRPNEIVLGRILGFTLVATVLLAVMAVCSYVFVSRGLDHNHELSVRAKTIRGVPMRYVGVRGEEDGETSVAQRHSHEVTIEADEFFPEIVLDALPDAGLVVSKVARGISATGLQEGDVVQSIDGIDVDSVSRDEAIRLLQGQAGSNVAMTVRRAKESIMVEVPRKVAETFTGAKRGHKHRVFARWSGEDGGKVACQVGPPEGMFVARVPKYGELRFRDSQGDRKNEKSWEFKQKGVSVGKVFSYRSYIRGNTLAAAIWTFRGLKSEDYPNGLDLDVNIRVYRSQLGQIDAPVTGSMFVSNPRTGARSQERIFSGKEFTVDQMRVPRKIWDRNDRLVDLFDDGIVSTDDPATPENEGGEIEVWISCVDPGQYFGMAQADVYIRARDASYTANFCKGFLGIWLQIVLVTALAVLFSTFLSGPVAMLLSFTTVLLGFNKDFLIRLTDSVLDPAKNAQLESYRRVYGGGPLEALYRIVTQRNLVAELEDNQLTTVIENLDIGLMFAVDKVLHLLPDFQQFLEVQYLSHGYNIDNDMVLQHIFATLAFLFAAYVIGYFVLKSRELAR